MLNKRSIQLICYILISIIFVFIISIIILNKYLNNSIIEKIKTNIYESTNHEYILNVDDLNINLFSQSINITNIIIEPLQKEKSTKNHFVFKSKSLRVIDLSIIKFLRERKIDISNIEFYKPELIVFWDSENGKRTDIESNYKNMVPLIKMLKVNHITIKDLKFNIFKNSYNVFPIFNSNTNYLNLQNINFDLSKIKLSEIIVFDKFVIVIDSFKCNIGNDSLYTVKTKKLYVDYNNSIMIFDSLKLIPNYSKNEFAKKAGKQTSRIEIGLGKIKIFNINYKLMLDEKRVSIHKIELVECNLDVYRDNRLPLAKIIRPSIQAMIKSVPFLISIDTIELKNSKIAFEAIHPHAFSTGKISINNFEVTVTGIQNDSCKISENQSVDALASGNIMNKGKFNLKYNFPLNTDKEHFYCSGSLSRMTLSTFNSIIIPVKNLQFRSGIIDYINFSFTAEENYASGIMKFKYHNLKIDMLNKLNSKNGLSQKLKSLLVNNFKIYESNPEIGGKIRISKINMVHNPYRFFLNYTIQSILSGVEPTILKDHEKNKKHL
jgi:hypothetical protein